MLLKPGTLINGRYKIIEQIGIGGMAVVYRAADEKLERDVTLKVLKAEYTKDEDFIRRFRTEARAAAKLSNTNVVSVYDVGDDDNVYYIVMEYVNGFTLKELIEKRAPFDDEVALGIAIQIASGLEHAHKHNIVHRDIKPENILITRDGTEGTIKVTDFGIAKAATSKTTSTNAMGSVHYFSPEQAKGDNVDSRTDIYSLGIVLFEMVTGTVPFDGDTPVALAMKHITEALPDVKKLNPRVSDETIKVINMATQKLADERYQTIDEMLIDLKAAAGANYKDEMRNSIKLSKEELEQIRSRDKRKYNDIDESMYHKNQKKTHKPKLSEADRKRERNTVIAAVITGLVLIILITAAGAFFMHIQNQDTVKVPNFIGLDIASAEQLAKNHSILIEEDQEYSDDFARDTVISQSVKKGKRIGKDESVVLKVSLGKEVIDMPQLLGLSIDDATDVIRQAGLLLVDTQYVASDEPTGTVISQSINAGVKVAPNTEITVSVSEGKNTREIEIPDVENMKKQNAVEMLEGLGFKTKIKESFSSAIEKGNVISQSIEAGTTVTAGTVIELEISKGEDTEKETEEKAPEETTQSQPENEPVTEEVDNGNTADNTPENVDISINPVADGSLGDYGDINGEFNVKIVAKNSNGERTVKDGNYTAGDFPFSISDTITESTDYDIYINGQYYGTQNVTK